MMSAKNIITKQKISIFYKVLILLFGWVGLYLTLANDDFTTLDAFNYFTIQTNLAVNILTIIFLVFEIVNYRKHKTHNRAMLTLKYVFTVEITIVFIMFFSIIAPFTPVWFAYNAQSMIMHLALPALYISEYFLFYKLKMPKMRAILYPLIFPLLYVVYILIISICGVTFFGAVVPYYFLDYSAFGWFSFQNGLGVAYWLMIMIIAFFIISALFYIISTAVMNAPKKKERKNSSDCINPDENEIQSEAAATKD